MTSFSIDKQSGKVNAEWMSRPVDSFKNQTRNQPLDLVLTSMEQSPTFAYRLKRKLLSGPIFEEAYTWNTRYTKLEQEFRVLADALDGKYAALQNVADETTRSSLKTDINRQLSFIRKSGIQSNYEDRKFNFGLRRILRLRNPKAKHLLDRYYLHLSRLAEPHDFAIEN